jgi:hypothetical protein
MAKDKTQRQSATSTTREFGVVLSAETSPSRKAALHDHERQQATKIVV